MTHKPRKAVVDKHLVELRREGVEALHRFNRIAGRVNSYERYLALNKCYDVRLAGSFLVIKGGNPADRTGTDKDPITNLTEAKVKKILIVEDNNDFREILNLCVTKLGYHAIKARNSKEAIEWAEAEGPDLIFMDMELPEVDGVKTSAMLKQNPKTAHIPIVALTAWISELWQEKAAKLGITTYLIKPVSPQTLKKTIEEYTNGSLARNAVSPRRR